MLQELKINRQQIRIETLYNRNFRCEVFSRFNKITVDIDTGYLNAYIRQNLLTSTFSHLMPRPNDLEDQALLQRIAEGDSKALRELHIKTARPLHSMAMKILSNSSEAEEVIQDIFVLVWKNAHKFNFEKAKVFTWMAVMMKNRCIDRIRAKKRRIPLYEVDDYTESSITEPDSKLSLIHISEPTRPY